MMNQTHHAAKVAIDGTLGAAGITTPFWLQLLEQGAQDVALIGGAILVIARLYLSYLEWRTYTDKRDGK